MLGECWEGGAVADADLEGVFSEEVLRARILYATKMSDDLGGWGSRSGVGKRGCFTTRMDLPGGGPDAVGGSKSVLCLFVRAWSMATVFW